MSIHTIDKCHFTMGASNGNSVASGKMHGLSLVEMLVAITLGVFLIGTLVQTYLGSKQTYNMTQGMSRMQENYRYAMSHFARNLDSGGHAGCLENDPEIPPSKPGNHISVLSSSTGANNFAVPVSGIDGGADPDTVIITRANGGYDVPVTGTMVDSQVNPTQPFTVNNGVTDYSRLQQYQILTLSDCSYAVTFMITNDPTSSGGVIQHQIGVTSPGPVNPGLSNSAYFPTSVAAFGDGATGGSLSTLYATSGVSYDIRTGAAGTAAGVACDLSVDSTHRFCSLFANNQELVEGVHDLQVTYGVPAGANVRYDTVNNLTTTEARNVESVRLALSLNTITSISEGDVIRKEYTKTFRVRNRAP